MRTVKDLIAQLRTFPDDAVCWVYVAEDSGVAIGVRPNENDPPDWNYYEDVGFIPCCTFRSLAEERPVERR